MRNTAALLLIFAFTLSSSAQRVRGVGATQPNAGDPLPSLTTAQLAAFNEGRGEFTEVESANDGLGPVFNGRSCAECHVAPAVGGGSRRTVTRFGMRNGATFDALSLLGGSLIQEHGI